MDESQVSRLLSRALDAVTEARIPDDLREIAFTTAIALLGGSTPPASQAPSSGGAQQTIRRTPNTGGTGSAVLDSIATGLEIDANKVRRVFAEKNGEPELIVKSGKLPRTRAAAAADIAMLVMAARQATELDDYTEAETLREACRRYGKFDQSNFGKHMNSLDNYIITDGKGVSARRKLTHPGIEAAAQLVDQYAAQG